MVAANQSQEPSVLKQSNEDFKTKAASRIGESNMVPVCVASCLLGLLIGTLLVYDRQALLDINTSQEMFLRPEVGSIPKSPTIPIGHTGLPVLLTFCHFAEVAF